MLKMKCGICFKEIKKAKEMFWGTDRNFQEVLICKKCEEKEDEIKNKL